MEVALPTRLKVCLVTPYPPQQKGTAEYAHMFIDALNRCSFQRHLQVRVISEFTRGGQKSRTVLYPPKQNFILEREYSDRLPCSNFSFLKIFKAILKDKPHVAHFYWPGGFGGFLRDFTGEPLLILFALLRLLSIRVAVTMHAVWLPQFAEKAAYKKTESRIIAKVVKAYFFIFMFILSHLANKILIGVVREHSTTTRRFAQSYKIPSSKMGEEPAGCLEISRRDPEAIPRIKRKLSIAEKRVILCFGFVRPDKGLEYAIEALAKIVKEQPNVALVIVGRAKSSSDINYLAKLKGLVKELDLEDNVVFDSRFIPMGDVINYYSVAEALLLPYKEHVGFSGPLNIAISLGVPVIATTVGEQMPGLASLIKLIPPKDVEALKDTLSEILSDTTLRDEIRAKLLSHAKEYSWPKTAHRLVREYAYMLVK